MVECLKFKSESSVENALKISLNSDISA